MDGEGHVVRAMLERLGDAARIDPDEVRRIVAPPGHLVPHLGVAEHGEGGVVELEIAAAFVVQHPHLVPVGGIQILPELIQIGIDVPVDQSAAAAVVGEAGGRDAEFRGLADMLLQEPEVIQHHPAGVGDPAGDLQRGDPLPALEGRTLMRRRLGDAVEAAEEIVVPGFAPELPVGNRFDAGPLLLPDGVDDAAILDPGELGGGHLARRRLRPRLVNLPRAQQAAHMVGPERGSRRIPVRHVPLPGAAEGDCRAASQTPPAEARAVARGQKGL